jgi:hypothetical protein
MSTTAQIEQFATEFHRVWNDYAYVVHDPAVLAQYQTYWKNSSTVASWGGEPWCAGPVSIILRHPDTPEFISSPPWCGQYVPQPVGSTAKVARLTPLMSTTTMTLFPHMTMLTRMTTGLQQWGSWQEVRAYIVAKRQALGIRPLVTGLHRPYRVLTEHFTAGFMQEWMYDVPAHSVAMAPGTYGFYWHTVPGSNPHEWQSGYWQGGGFAEPRW